MNKFLEYFDLHAGSDDKQRVLDNVTANISFRGANLWVLACAIVIASVGLNVNSTAVIIGAMLISPLMGPIVGAGFALGTYDFDLLKKSLKNLLIATAAGLFVSAAYFYVSPFKDMQSELSARISPNIYDVLIAFFGGLVGVIAITRLEKGNPIAGVAIATALMPPLCTAGYGLAVGNFVYFFGAIYLYTINCFFICIATFFIIKFLKYPVVKILYPRYEKQIRWGISILILLMIIPSFYLAYNLLNEKKFVQKVERFISNEFTNKGYIIIYKKTNFSAKPKRLELAFFNKRFEEEEMNRLFSTMKAYDLNNTKLVIRQDTTNLKNDILNEIGNRNKALTEKEILIKNLQAEIARNRFDNGQILKEAKVLFPQITNLSVARHQFNTNTDSIRTVTAVLYQSENDLPNAEQQKLSNWLREKLNTKELSIYRQQR